MFLLSYLPVFPAFLRLRKDDPNTERPFRVPGGPGVLKLLTFVPMVLIVVAVIFTAFFPLSFDKATLAATLPITVGSILCIILGEIVIALCHKKK
jgi:amino acid transporter